ncbi:hypothetical protein DMUE_0425 [Dictyocoela muelleri]|nr:hypothetical protein DMUE_0425 [Dictyocoela muelleri]
MKSIKLKIILIKIIILKTLNSYDKNFRDLYCQDVSIDGRIPKNIFFVHFWSVVTRVKNDIPKTTNNLEGWHRSLNNNFLCSHPSMYEFSEEIKKQHAIVENKINKLFITVMILNIQKIFI